MNNPKPVAIWARIGAGLLVGVGAAAALGVGLMYWRDRVIPNLSGYEWVFLAYAGWGILPSLLSVALKGDVSWGRVPAPQSSRMGRYKCHLSAAFLVVSLGVGWRYEPIATSVFAIFFAFIMLCVGLRIYFMPIKTKFEGIAKAKARHGIPLGQPHHTDRILKSGYFRIP